MKKHFIQTLYLVIGVVLTYIATFFTSASPDLLYTISKPIPASLFQTGDMPGFLQQLEINNSGNATSEKIKVKIAGVVDKYSIKSDSQSDKAEVSNNENMFEVAYPELPPNGSFTLSIRVLNGAATPSSIRVSDNKGLARLAFSDDSFTRSSSFYLLVLACGIYIYFVTYSARGVIMARKDQSIVESGTNTILHASRPFYYSKKEWNRTILWALTVRLNNDTTLVATQEWTCYAVLSIDKPTDITEADWKKSIDRSSDRFNNLIMSKLLSTTLPEFDEFLEMKKPKNLSDELWKRLVVTINARYAAAAEYDNLRSGPIEAFLRTTKPPMIEDHTWEAIVARLQRRRMTEIWTETGWNLTPYDHLLKIDLTVLKDEQRREMLSGAYYRQNVINMMSSKEKAESFLRIPDPPWLDPPTLHFLKENARAVIEIEKKKVEISTTEEKLKELDKHLAAEKIEVENLRRKLYKEVATHSKTK